MLEVGGLRLDAVDHVLALNLRPLTSNRLSLNLSLNLNLGGI